ncbi:unnamed protein product, partial [marine sediment metagenome]
QDAVEALVKLMQNSQSPGQVFNLGSQEEITIKGLAEKIIQFTHSNSQVVYIPYDQAYEEGFEDMQRRVPDISKIQNLIGYRPTVNLEGILKSVIEYFKGEELKK